MVQVNKSKRFLAERRDNIEIKLKKEQKKCKKLVLNTRLAIILEKEDEVKSENLYSLNEEQGFGLEDGIQYSDQDDCDVELML